MTTTASLPMYNPPGMRDANSAFWSALGGLLRSSGLNDAPLNLSFDRSPVPDAIGPEVLFTQTCGYPLQTIYRGQHQMLARPVYDAPGCTGSTHSAFIIVPKDSTAMRMEDLRGKRFALNSHHSNSGMNLPRLMLARMGVKAPFFGEVIETGSHGASIRLVSENGADCASIDCLTYAFLLDYQPEVVAGLRLLAQTPPSPSIPFVTSAQTDPEVVAALKRSLFKMSEDPQYGPVLAGLRIARIEPAPRAEYDALLGLEREARDLGYPQIA